MSNMHLKKLILEVVDNQLRDNDPPSTKETYQALPENPRLVRTGEEGGTVYRLYEEEGKQIASLCLIEAPEGETSPEPAEGGTP